MGISAIKADLENYTVAELITVARFYGLDTSASLPDLLQEIAELNYNRSVDRGEMRTEEAVKRLAELESKVMAVRKGGALPDLKDLLAIRELQETIEASDHTEQVFYSTYMEIVKGLDYEDVKNLCGLEELHYPCKYGWIWKAWAKGLSNDDRFYYFLGAVMKDDDPRLLDLMLEAGVSQTAMDDALLMAVDRRARLNLDVIRKLIEAGANVNATTEFDYTPLHIVTKGFHHPGQEVAIKYLVKAGADVNAKTNFKATPLHHAAMNGKLDIVKILVEAGADVKAKDETGLKAIDWAPFQRTEGKDVIDYLREKAK